MSPVQCRKTPSTEHLHLGPHHFRLLWPMFSRSKKRPASHQPAPVAPQQAQTAKPQQLQQNGQHYHQQRPSSSNPYYQHNQPPPPPTPRPFRQPPPGADLRFWGIFCNVDKDGSGAIDVRELQQALINSNWTSESLPLNDEVGVSSCGRSLYVHMANPAHHSLRS